MSTSLEEGFAMPAHSSTDPSGAFTHWPSIVVFVGAVVLAVAGDLLVKHIAFERVANEPVVITPAIQQDPEHEFSREYPHEAITVVPKFLALRLVTNGGAVFGVG